MSFSSWRPRPLSLPACIFSYQAMLLGNLKASRCYFLHVRAAWLCSLSVNLHCLHLTCAGESDVPLCSRLLFVPCVMPTTFHGHAVLLPLGSFGAIMMERIFTDWRIEVCILEEFGQIAFWGKMYGTIRSLPDCCLISANMLNSIQSA
jgi:hypothetical protein